MGSYLAVSADPGTAGSPPPQDMARVLDLQELDLGIGRLRTRLESLRGQSDVREARDRVADVEARVGEIKLQADDVSNQQRRLENDIDSIGRKIEDERKRLFDGSVANPKELQSIEHEVQSLGQRKTRMEDLLLEHMERAEELQGHLGPLEAEAAEARDRLAEIESTSARELVEIEQALEQREAERTALTAGVDPDLLELYQDLRRSKKGVAAAALIDGICQGCHQKLSPVYLDRLRRETGVRRCEYCRRILVPR